MTAHVAVVDPLPMYQLGAAAALAAAGHTVETPADVMTWVRERAQGVVLLTLESEADWGVLDRLRAVALTHPAIALIVVGAETSGVRAVRTGARSVLLRRVTEDVLLRTVEATIDGQAVMPAEVAAALTASTPAGAALSGMLSPEQMSWLRQLAAGATVTQLAGRAGYSERAMYRLLKALYRQMGVGNRIQAIVRAQGQGWLGAEAPRQGPGQPRSAVAGPGWAVRGDSRPVHDG